ncbi:MAG TPA: rhomboid family intramembrane serine protease [Chloroflexia bacterium]|nr:rhomboid family intramembrane serine protease [Chloroflexia bacterium]
MLPIGDEGTPPSRGFPIVNITIIAICVIVFLIQLMFGADQSVMAYGTIPWEITHGRDLGPSFCPPAVCQGLPEQSIAFPVYITLLTSMFMHASWVHIGGNMLFLFIFGDNVEDAMGHLGYAVFYLLCGLAANFAQIIVGPDSPIPGIGASGAIAGVLAAYLILFPQAQVRVLAGYYGIARVPALVMIGFWFLIQLVSGVGSVVAVQTTGGGVAYWAHIGGFIAGLILVWVFRRGGGTTQAY